MNANGPALRDIHVPPVSWWPPAIGWWLLAVLVLVAMVVSVWLALRYRRRLHPRRAARRELEMLAAHFARDRDARALAAGVSKLLRRIALIIEPAAAARDSIQWRVFLASRAPAGGMRPGRKRALCGWKAAKLKSTKPWRSAWYQSAWCR